MENFERRREEGLHWGRQVPDVASRPTPVYPEAVTRFDEFQAYHMSVAEVVHHVGQFLPWHRLYLRLYDQAMRTECGYKGPTPLHTSPVWDPNTGFGGNGVPGTYTLPPNINVTSNRIFPESFVGCVKDGPFADHTVHLGPGQLRTNHCLVRGLNESQYVNLDAQAVARTLAQPTYEQFWIELEGQPLTSSFRLHDGGHVMVGGEMSNFYSSPGDPIFYLHHGNLDRIWWQWQQQSSAHLYEISGRSTPDPPFQNVTLDFVLPFGELGSSLPIRDVMDIHASPNCYTYA
ncbi:unnamed protein product [Cyclocybe aegerita]|uniref:Tyrosinase copper-binding domain-containing protein n=1 Tax=Cyclocybe aegerita TaxID=1973307 RepID=A0A8S0W339_CYCAE|nr:unnamed protein product [Cyclocybe aegerita]